MADIDLSMFDTYDSTEQDKIDLEKEIRYQKTLANNQIKSSKWNLYSTGTTVDKLEEQRGAAPTHGPDPLQVAKAQPDLSMFDSKPVEKAEIDLSMFGEGPGASYSDRVMKYETEGLAKVKEAENEAVAMNPNHPTLAKVGNTYNALSGGALGLATGGVSGVVGVFETAGKAIYQGARGLIQGPAAQMSEKEFTKYIRERPVSEWLSKQMLDYLKVSGNKAAEGGMEFVSGTIAAGLDKGYEDVSPGFGLAAEAVATILALRGGYTAVTRGGKPKVEPPPKDKPTSTEGLLDSLVDKPIEDQVSRQATQLELGLERPEPVQLPLTLEESVKPESISPIKFENEYGDVITEGQGSIVKKYLKEIISKVDGVHDFGNTFMSMVYKNRAQEVKTTYKQYLDTLGKADVPTFDKFIASKLLGKIDDVSIRFEDFKTLEAKHGPDANTWGGFYDTVDHSVHINTNLVKDVESVIRVINHEGIHGVTKTFIDNNPKHPLTTLLWDLFNDVKTSDFAKRLDSTNKQEYGLKNPHEFLAELSNPRFVDYLNTVKIPEALAKRIREETGTKGFIKSTYDAFTRIMGKILGFDPKETNALAASMHMYSKLADGQTTKSINKNRIALFEEGGPFAGSPFSRTAAVEMSPKDVSAVERAVSKALSYSHSAKEFALHMKSSRLSEIDISKIIARAEELFAKKSTITQKIKNEGWKNKVEEHYTRDDRTTPEMLDTLPKNKDGSIHIEDINPTGLTLTTSSWASTTKLESKNPEGARVIKHMYDKLQDIKEMGHRLISETKPLLLEADKAVRELFKTGENKLAVAKAFNYFAKNTEWFDGKNYYPTKEQLMASGKLTEIQANKYLADSKIYSKAWDNIEMANAKRGMPNPPRIPGYVPHVREGGYSYVLEAKTESGGWEIADRYNFTNGWAAKNSLKNIEKTLPENIRVRTDDFGKQIEKPSDSSGSLDMSGIHEQMAIISNYNGQFKQLRAFLDKLEESSTEGVLIHNLERDPKLGGHVMDKLDKGTANKTDMKVIMDLPKKVFEASVKYLENVSYATDVHQPLMEAGLPKNLRKAVTDVGDTFVGKDKGLDEWLQQQTNHTLSLAGIPAHTITNMNKIIASSFSKTMLFGSNSFYISNMVQPVNALTALFRADAIAGENRSARGSISLAIARTAKELPGLLKDVPEMLLLNKAGRGEMTRMAEDMGKSDPTMMEQLDPVGFKDRISKVIEERGRVISFSLGYHYAKQFMPEAKAREFAGAVADEAMVPYDKDLGRPIGANRMGTLPSVFITYPAHELGMVHQDIKRIVNNPKALRSYAPVAATILAKYGMYGVYGITFATTADQIIRLLNSSQGTNIPTIKERVHGNDLMEFGAISVGLGMDVSSSGSGASPSLALGGIYDLMGSIVDTLKLGLQATGHEVFGVGLPVTRRHWAEAGKNAPASISWYLEEALQSKDAGDYAKRIVGGWKGERKSMSLKKGTLEPLYERTPEETQTRAIFGSKSLNEAKELSSIRIHKEKEARLTEKTQGLVDLLKDNQQGLITLTQKDRNHIRSKLAEQGWTVDDIAAALEAEVIKRKIPYDKKQGLKAMNSESLRSQMGYKRWQELNK